MKKKYIHLIVILCLGIFLANCEGEDGEPGDAGEFGLNGVNGTDGENGTDGTNGLGFDELTQNGSFIITFTGTRSDNLSFSKTEEFKYTSNTLNFSSNNVTIDESDISFNMTRYLGTPNVEPAYGTSLNINLDVENVGEETESFYINFGLYQYDLVFDDLKFINFNDSFQSDGINVSNFEISDYSFDEETNAVTFTFSTDIDVSGDDRLTSLSMAVVVDAVAAESIDGGGIGGPF
ncbi:collagen-like protein [Aquimarina pacifica]|uniref:collagen-like protein n=1 Tax=Aquimarina pacifica TaxID=1296415 RepID=UPI0004728FA8|nr:collagen-like protein [Aquimarina pacifica]